MHSDYIGGPPLAAAPDARPTGAGAGIGRPKLPLVLQYWRIALRWKWVIISIVIAALVIGLVVTMFMTPMYTSTSTIEISRQRDRIVNVQSVEPEVSAVDLEFYQTQYSLLRARSLAQRVATDLRLADSNELFDAFGIDPESHLSLFGDSDRAMTPQRRAQRMNMAIDILLDHISIAPVRNSALVEVSFTSPKADLSRRVVTAWTNGFVASNLDRRFEASSYARSFLENRLGQLRQRLEESERRVVQYASSQRIISIPSEMQGAGERSLVADDLARLNAALVDATTDRVRAETRLAGARANVSTEVLTNPTITALREKRAEAAADYSKMLARFEPEYPQAKALASQIRQLDQSIGSEEARIRTNLSSVYRDASARETALRARLEQLKNGALDLRRRSIQYNIYQREADTNRQLYDALLQRYKEIGVAGGVGTNNVLVVDAASMPEKPSSPKLLLNLLVALSLGLLGAAAVLFVLEQADETVKDPLQVEPALGIPSVGTIPLVDGDAGALLADRKSVFSEAYLSLQTNLRFSTSHGVPRSIGITSTRPAEGKSTTSSALAQTLARLNKAVVLVDCDMRSPSIHHMLSIPNDRGVSNFLSGDDDVATMLKASTIAGMDLLVAGPQPPNAAELLNGTRLRELVSILTERYDHVIIDCPPVIGLADALLIGGQVEGVVYVVGANGAVTSVIRSAMDRLRGAKVNLLGAVLTKFKASQAFYGYGYEHGYGYGQEDKSE